MITSYFLFASWVKHDHKFDDMPLMFIDMDLSDQFIECLFDSPVFLFFSFLFRCLCPFLRREVILSLFAYLVVGCSSRKGFHG